MNLLYALSVYTYTTLHTVCPNIDVCRLNTVCPNIDVCTLHTVCVCPNIDKCTVKLSPRKIKEPNIVYTHHKQVTIKWQLKLSTVTKSKD